MKGLVRMMGMIRRGSPNLPPGREVYSPRRAGGANCKGVNTGLHSLSAWTVLGWWGKDSIETISQARCSCRCCLELDECGFCGFNQRVRPAR
jgi:hypothetical protein